MPKYECEYNRGHVVIKKDGEFFGTADTMNEAAKDIEQDKNEIETRSRKDIYFNGNKLVRHRIINPGKCVLCRKDLIYNRDGIFLCKECQSRKED